MTQHADGLNSLQGREAGKHCFILGGGPSGKGNWAKKVHDFSIVINGAYQNLTRGAPDYWVQLDYDSPMPPWFEDGYEQFAGNPGTTMILSHVLRESHPQAIHCKVSTDEPELRSARLGLKMCDATGDGTRLEGTSALCALHLCGILGASKVSMIGVDLMFGDKGKLHHPYPCRNYGEHPTTSGQEMQPYKWRFGYDKATDKFAHTVYTCDWFRRSAFRIKEYMQFAAANGMECRDYSNGLLSLI